LFEVREEDSIDTPGQTPAELPLIERKAICSKLLFRRARLLPS
jgi:hypothetical protein